jgi:hypothetical protein
LMETSEEEKTKKISYYTYWGYPKSIFLDS